MAQNLVIFVLATVLELVDFLFKVGDVLAQGGVKDCNVFQLIQLLLLFLNVLVLSIVLSL